MASGVRTFIYPVKDIDRAKALFGTLLSATPSVDTPYYAQFDIGEMKLGLDPSGHDRGFIGSVAYWEVDDVQVAFAAMIAAGATEHEGVREVGGGTLIASVKDADGNVIGLIQPGE